MKFDLTQIIKRQLTAAIGSFLTFALVFQVTFYSATGSANATTLNSAHMFAASVSSMTKQVEGKAEQAVGNAQQSLEEAAARVSGTGKEIKGKAKEDIGNVQSSAEDAKYGMRRGMNSIKSNAKQASAKAEEKTGNAIDAVKGFFGK
jgi:uncharacterized protein YjbJ (UPF0337 family)